MALRLADTEQWNSHFVRGLPGPYRAFWIWLHSACNHAGVWEIDLEIARMRTGFNELEQNEAERLFLPKMLILECGEKWFLLNFCEDQYKTTLLNPANTAHRGVIRILEKLNLIDLNFNVLKEQKKPLESSLKATKDLDLSIPVVKIKVNKNKEVKITKSVPKSYNTPYTEAFKHFREMRVKIKKPLTEHATGMIHKKLSLLSNDNEDLKIAILEQSTLNCWQDVFAIREDYSKSKTAGVIDIATQAKYTGS